MTTPLDLLNRMKASIEALPWQARRPQLDSFLRMIDEYLSEHPPIKNHVKATHPPDKNCGPYGCNVCNLFICSVCGGAEGSLPTECPGYRMPPTMADLVYAGAIDYVGGQWVTKDLNVVVRATHLNPIKNDPISAEPGDL
jgi:hypothetical protein